MNRREQIDWIKKLLKSESTLALATVDSNGLPQVAPVFYCADDALRLFWFSSEKSRHSLNLSEQAHVAGTIYPSVKKWQQIRGLQIEGTAAVERDLVRRNLMTNAYCERFELNTMLRLAIKQSTLYCLRPQRMRAVDNSKRFGYKFELEFEE